MPRIYDTPRIFKSSLHFQNSLYFSSPHKHNNLLHESSKTRLEIALHERKKKRKKWRKVAKNVGIRGPDPIGTIRTEGRGREDR